MRQLSVYVDTSVVGGCEDEEFSQDTLKLWDMFRRGEYMLVVSDLTLQEIESAPEAVRLHLFEVPIEYQIMAPISVESRALADAYLAHGVVGPEPGLMRCTSPWPLWHGPMCWPVGISNIS